MTTQYLTLGQKKFLLESLEKQVSPKTQAEKDLYNQLREELAETLTGEAQDFKRCGKFVKMIEMDTFGDRYNNCWIKIQTSSKGEFFTSTYMGGRRIYIS